MCTRSSPAGVLQRPEPNLATTLESNREPVLNLTDCGNVDERTEKGQGRRRETELCSSLSIYSGVDVRVENVVTTSPRSAPSHSHKKASSVASYFRDIRFTGKKEQSIRELSEIITSTRGSMSGVQKRRRNSSSTCSVDRPEISCSTTVATT